jgi:serine/threonine-protein kinase ATR
VLQAYPQQALWTMAAVSKSTVSARRTAATEILRIARNGLPQESEKALFTQFASLIDEMIRLCFHQPSAKARVITLSNDFGSLKRMMPVGIIMPVQRALTVTLPTDGLTNASYNPFASGDYSTISGIGEEIEILASLQKPKKVIVP